MGIAAGSPFIDVGSKVVRCYVRGCEMHCEGLVGTVWVLGAEAEAGLGRESLGIVRVGS